MENEKPKYNNIEYCKKWYEKNKEKHLQYMKQQLRCDVCDKLMTRSHYNRHTKSRIHKLLMNQKPVINP